jgi:hypothetical protein
MRKNARSGPAVYLGVRNSQYLEDHHTFVDILE